MMNIGRRLLAGDITLALEIPAESSRDVARGRTVLMGDWIEGAMPSRAVGTLSAPATAELRYCYNPDVASIVAIVPATIPQLLMLIPMLTALSATREKELG